MSVIGSAASPPALRRAMGLGDTALFLVVAVVSPRCIAAAAAAGPSALVIWLIALAAFFIPMAFAVIELSSRHPDEGGIYVWTRRAFGDFASFMTSWMYWVSNLVYFPGLLYFAVGNALLMAGERGAALAGNGAVFIGASLVGLAIAFLLNAVGLGVGKWLHNVGAIATWVPVAMLIGLAAAVWAPRPRSPRRRWRRPPACARWCSGPPSRSPSRDSRRPRCWGARSPALGAPFPAPS